MKQPTLQHNDMDDLNWDELDEILSEYNTYIENHLKTLFDFDIWFEHTKNKEFPKEWYKIIRESDAHK